MARENKICKTTILPTGVQLDFADSTSLVCDVNSLPQETIVQAALFGIRRKVTNSFADVEGDVEKAKKEARETWDQLLAGQWTAPRETSASPKATSDLVEAVIRVTGKAREVVEAKLESMTKEDRTNLRKNDQINAALLAIKSERASAKASKGTLSVGALFD